MITISNYDHWIIQQVENNGDKEFLTFNSKSFTYNQVFANSKKAVNYFKSTSIKKNDHVAILAEHSIEFVPSILGLWLIGAVPVLLNEKSTKEELLQLLEISKSKILLSTKQTEVKNIPQIVFDLKSLEEYSGNFETEKFHKNKTAILMFTSGSTGIPKCVEITFENLFQSAVSADSFINHNDKDIWLASLPFCHIGGFSIFTRTLISGCSFVIPKSLKENDLSETIKKYKPSLISVVPIMLKRLLEEFRNPWKNLRIVFLGGGSVSKELVKTALKQNWKITIVYGSTETSSMVSLSSVENIKKFGISAGKSLPEVEVQILDSNKNNVENGIAGQIVISSKSIAKGYFNLSSEENNQLRDGKYSSNDIGKIDKNGNLQIIGRKDDIIISGGENISLNEIEKIVQQKFNFKNLTAIGIKDKKWDQSYVLVVEGDKSDLVEKEIIEYFKQNISSYKLPKKILFQNNFPTTELGKIKKMELAKKLRLNVL